MEGLPGLRGGAVLKDGHRRSVVAELEDGDADGVEAVSVVVAAPRDLCDLVEHADRVVRLLVAGDFGVESVLHHGDVLRIRRDEGVGEVDLDVGDGEGLGAGAVDGQVRR